MMCQMRDSFGDVEMFVRAEELPMATAKKLTDILDDLPICRKLKMELAITSDATELFVTTTYNMEGDGPLAIHAYEQMKALYNHVSLRHFPNVAAVARQLADGNVAHERQLVAYVGNCVTEAHNWTCKLDTPSQHRVPVLLTMQNTFVKLLACRKQHSTGQLPIQCSSLAERTHYRHSVPHSSQL